MDYDTWVKTMKQILKDEIEDPEILAFTIKNHMELFEYIASGRVNIRIHRDIEGEMWFGVGGDNKLSSATFQRPLKRWANLLHLKP